MSEIEVTPPAPLDPRLGRHPDWDDRNYDYPIRTLLAATLVPRSYTWSCFPYLNQGNVGACVGFSITHDIAARPVVLPVTHTLAMKIYKQAQSIDPWPGDNYEGTSVLAGIKTAQALGYVKEYRWALSLEDLILTIGYKGPVVLGINWYEGMFDPDADGLLHITGRLAGGHAILANGVSVPKRRIRLHNSWSNGWGLNGDAFLTFSDMERLLRENGDACVPLLRTKPLV